MYDILPFPNITSTEPKEQIGQINNYLIQLKEELEFILTNIGADNLSEEIMAKINSVGGDVSTSQEEIEQIANNGLKLSDVINSQLFKDETIKGVKVNGEELVRDADRKVNVPVPMDYIVDGEQTTVSEESEGVNVFTFRNANGEEYSFEVRNGSKGDTGDKGERGDAFAYEDFTEEQLAALKGDKGDKGDPPTITFSIDFATGNLTYTTS